MSQQNALLVALNALQAIDDEHPYPIAKHAIVQISKALSQPEQEPVAWLWKDGTVTTDPDRADGTWTPLYALDDEVKHD